MKQELLDKVLGIHLDAVRERFKSPFRLDGMIYATDGVTMLRLPEGYSTKTYEDGACDVVGFFDGFVLEDGIEEESLVEVADGARICDKTFSKKVYERLVETTRLLGLDGWYVYKKDGKYEPLLLRNKDVSLLVMPVQEEGEEYTPIPNGLVYDDGIHEDRGLEYMKTKEKKERELSEKRERVLGKNYNRIYAVTLKKTSTMYVEASSPYEAMGIAEKNKYDSCLDFEDAEVEECESSPSEAKDYMGHIFTMDGVVSYSSYKAKEDNL